MNGPAAEHFPHIFLAGVKASPAKPLIFERHARMFISVLRREVAAQVNLFSRAMHSIGAQPEARVALCGLKPSRYFWISEMAALTMKAVAVIIPADISDEERVAILAESHAHAVVVQRLEDALRLAACAQSLPKLRVIVCLSGSAKADIPIMDWKSFTDLGKAHPDSTVAMFSRITADDTALLFYSRDESGQGHKVVRYSHRQLLEHARMIERMLGTQHPVGEEDIFLSSPAWEQPVEHIASCFLPLLKQAALQTNDSMTDFICLENHPPVMIAPARYLDLLRENIERHARHSGLVEWKLFEQSLIYGKQKFERGNSLWLPRRMLDNALKATVVRKVSKHLGGRLRLIIGTDDAARYETQLFFHTLGVDLVEIPQETVLA